MSDDMDIGSDNSLGDRIGKVCDAIYKKAIGYTTVNVVDELAASPEGDMTIVRRKVTYKDAEPDIAAAKLMLEMNKDKDNGYEGLSDEELEAEKARLLAELDNARLKAK